MRNDRTPRELADCSFMVGHPRIPRQRKYGLADFIGVAMTLAAFAAMGVMLAWRG